MDGVEVAGSTFVMSGICLLTKERNVLKKLENRSGRVEEESVRS